MEEDENDKTSSITLGTPATGGAVKIYFDINESYDSIEGKMEKMIKISNLLKMIKIGNNKYDWVGDFQPNGTAIARLDGKEFHIGRDGKPLYKERYNIVGAFQPDGTAWVRLESKFFHIGIDGKPLYTERYDDVKNFQSDGTAKVKLDRKYFHIGKDGKRVD